MRIYRSLLIGVVYLSGAFAHSPLLPKPREIHYGSGQIPLRGLSIRLAASAAEEDRFAAQELAAILSARSSTPVTIAQDAGAAALSIVLKRTGPVAALAQPGENPGPDSREAYRLKITPSGGEIEANSSAGLFYAVETLRQLIEGDDRGGALPEVEIRDWPELAYRRNHDRHEPRAASHRRRGQASTGFSCALESESVLLLQRSQYRAGRLIRCSTPAADFRSSKCNASSRTGANGTST